MPVYTIARDRAFVHNLVHISGKTGRFFMKFLSQMHLCTRKYPLKIWKSSGSGSGVQISTPNPVWIRLGGVLRSPSVTVTSVLYAELV